VRQEGQHSPKKYVGTSTDGKDWIQEETTEGCFPLVNFMEDSTKEGNKVKKVVCRNRKKARSRGPEGVGEKA